MTEADIRRAVVERATFEHSYHEDDNRYPRDFWHVRASVGSLSTGWRSYGHQEASQQVPAEVLAAESAALADLTEDAVGLFRFLGLAGPAAAPPPPQGTTPVLSDRVAELEAALRPFAEYHPAIMAMGGNYPKTGVLVSIESSAVGLRELTVEDFERARALTGGV